MGASCLITGERDGAGIGLLAVRPVSPECARLSCWIGLLWGVSRLPGVFGAVSQLLQPQLGALVLALPPACLRILRASFLLVQGDDCLAELSKSLAHQLCVEVEPALWQP